MKTFNHTTSFLIGVLFFSLTAHAQIITTFAGGGTSGLGDGGPAVDAQIATPIGLAIDAAGNMYIGDRDYNRIRKVNTAGIISTIAGTGAPGYSGDGGPATIAEIKEPYGVTTDNAGNVYFVDGYNNCVRKISTLGIISTIAGIGGTYGYNGDNIPATAAQLDGPGGVAVDALNNIYLTDGNNNRIRKINTSGIITTIAGTGTAGNTGDNGAATAAEINSPYSILLDGAGNLYVGSQAGNRVRKINASGVITTFAGTGTAGFSGDNGPATAAEITRAEGLAMDVAGNIYISDNLINRVRKVNPSGIITTYAGSGAPDYNGDNIPATMADIIPTGLASDGIGNLFIADAGNERIRRLTSTVSVNNVKIGDRVLIYPNPAPEDFTINISSNLNEQAQIIITNTIGEKVKEFTVRTNTPLNIHLDVPAGIYFLTAVTAQGRWSYKLMIASSLCDPQSQNVPIGHKIDPKKLVGQYMHRSFTIAI